MRTGFRRTPVPQPARADSRVATFVPPVRGWIRNENLAASSKGGAYTLDNFFPTTKDVRLRGGSRKYATVSTGRTLTLMHYISSAAQQFFAADENNIFDISTVADADAIPTASVTGQTSGEYSTAQIATVGGNYMYAVNGTDEAQLYDGTEFFTVNGLPILDIAYDAETGTFTEGLVITGGTSGATATILTLTDNGATGNLRVRLIAGTFQDNETITDSSTGSADADIPSGAVTVVAALTGVDTSAFSFVWLFANRLFFIESGTMNTWYLGTDSIGGAASTFSLNGIFQNGGSLLFGGTWSLDSGAGLDDKCVFVSTTGEVAIYEGTNPASASTWAKVGVYQITAPMGKNATLKAGGDLVIATEDGMVPITAAVQKDSAALSLAAITRAIEPEWKTEVGARRSQSWDVLKWPSNNMAVVSLPVIDGSTEAYCFVVNLETGAWCRYTGWDTQCLGIFNQIGYFGTSDGKVMQMEVGGTDDGTPYTGTCVWSWDHLANTGAHKTVKSMRGIFTADSDVNSNLSISTNYAESLPTVPSSIADYTTDTWDVGLWDTAIWSVSVDLETKTQWQSIGRTGFVVAPQVQITSGVTPTPHINIVSLTMMYEVGGVMV